MAKAFAIPDLWWTVYCHNSNGYLGCEYNTDEEGKVLGISRSKASLYYLVIHSHQLLDTWSLFMTKQVVYKAQGGAMEYDWYYLNAFTRWIQSSKQTVILLADPNPLVTQRIESTFLGQMIEKRLGEPFWMYTWLVEEVVNLQDRAVWNIRDLLRETEKNRMSSLKPQPDYPYLHDLSRHTIHVSETLDLAILTTDSILSHHNRVIDKLSTGASPKGISDWVHNRLLFFQHMLRSLSLRSGSNKERLQNEINLAFNTVAQSDARTSVDISRATQSDSAAMKSIAFVTLAFLPATFISAVFSMSFFSFDSDSGSWSVSDKFWIYWAVSIPVTIFATVFSIFWNRLFLPMLQENNGIHEGPRESIMGRINDIRLGLLRKRRVSGNQEAHLLF
jgi:hypothetical protein